MKNKKEAGKNIPALLKAIAAFIGRFIHIEKKIVDGKTYIGLFVYDDIKAGGKGVRAPILHGTNGFAEEHEFATAADEILSGDGSLIEGSLIIRKKGFIKRLLAQLKNKKDGTQKKKKK